MASSALEEWQAADRIAREAEAQLRGAWKANRFYGCDPPARKLMEDAAALRAKADSKMKEAMASAGVTGHSR